ncbi:MAG: HAMP domain-containing histidine kinase [Sulfurovum sp.]|uniref:sensor histidine kinase n=1 Tax=Sulfurovum sp. TaxID=1969726 RepID=UPI00286805DC|nr:HAMP domain-containing sensor histidine kinase [Sulfurovum sp.]MCO4845439.1 HAMP domain-containing histidine kinase [Sulfurovum sp.]
MNKYLSYILPLLTIADTSRNTDDEKRQHGFLIYMGLLMSTGGLVWGTLCLYHDIYIAAMVPYAYIIITILNFTYLYFTKKFQVSQNIQIIISLLLPFFFQFFLGGFIASGGNVLWSVIAVFGSFTISDKSKSILWLFLFIALMIFSGLVDPYAKPYDIALPEAYIIGFFVINFILIMAIIFSLYYYFVSTEEKVRLELQESLAKLEQAQNILIESEKMASLGSLVSGIAHEINTPLGVGLTGISQMDHELQKLESNYKEDMLTEEALKEYMNIMNKLIQTIRDRLNNAVTLVKSFKHISVDQHFEDQREFNLKQYVDSIILGFHTPLNDKQVKVINNIDNSIILDSYPGIFSQIFSNLILNSLKHAFEEGEDNVITISMELTDQFILNYQDNGIGISSENEKKIFDPFFTTKRGQGGSGLGLHIIYNLITQQLKGTLKLMKVSPHGLGFRITLDPSIIKAKHG